MKNKFLTFTNQIFFSVIMFELLVDNIEIKLVNSFDT
jgi:hypothetical protein